MDIPKYLPCLSCKDSREAGDWALARECRSCEGTGSYRNPETYVCNNCGDNLCLDNGRYPHGLVDAKVGGGYNSFHLMDCTLYTFSLCEKCLRAMFNVFKIPPAVMDTIGQGTEAYADDLDYYNYRLWKEAVGDHERLLAGGCNWREHCSKPASWRILQYNKTVTNKCRCEDHKWHGVYSLERIAPFANVPFLKAETNEQKAQEANAWLMGIPYKPEDFVNA